MQYFILSFLDPTQQASYVEMSNKTSHLLFITQ